MREFLRAAMGVACLACYRSPGTESSPTATRSAEVVAHYRMVPGSTTRFALEQGNRRVSGEAIDVRTGARRTLSTDVVIVAFGRLDSLVATQSPGDTAIAPRTRSDSLVRYLCGDGASLSASISERGQSRRVTADSCPDGSPGGARYLVLIDLVRLLER